MMIKIGFVMSRPFVPFIEDIKESISQNSELLMLVVDSNIEVVDVYNQYLNEVDCFIFSGRVLYYSLLEKIGFPEKDCYIVDDFQGDIKAIFLKLLLQNRTFDFRRVFVDTAFEYNDFAGIKELLPESEYPYFNSFDLNKLEESTQKTLERHFYLHESGLIDLSITRFGTIVTKLESKGYPYLYMYPPKDYMVNFLMQIINAHQLKSNKSITSAAITILFPPNKKFDTHAAHQISDFFIHLGMVKGYDFILQMDQQKIEILTQYVDLEDLTQSFKSIEWASTLRLAVPDTFFIGLGSGNNLHQARLNAFKAADYGISKENRIYHIDSMGKLHGPISNEESSELSSIPNEKIIALSKQFHVDHLSLQKIISFAKLTETTKITGSDLSDYLKVTLRSANRIINRIEQNGGAEPYFEKLNEGRGRPKRYSDMLFIKGL